MNESLLMLFFILIFIFIFKFEFDVTFLEVSKLILMLFKCIQISLKYN